MVVEMKQRMRGLGRLAGIFGAVVLVFSATNGNAQIAKTPPMGFNTWNNFACNVSQDIIQGIADAMSTNGMKDAGYTYVNVDDCWEGSRDANGFIGTTNKWTGNSLKGAADYVHSKGMKFGAYTSLGSKTCAGYPATLGYESQDVRQWVNWGLDYIKVDWCNVNGTQTGNPGNAYKVLGDTIKKYAGTTSARPLLFSICNWGVGNSWTFGRKSGGQIWRTTPDINASWGSITGIIDQQVNLFSYSGPGAAGEPGGWNDPDMLEVGRGTLSNDENKAHFGMWCLLAAPLIAGNDVRSMTTAVRDIIINKEVIAIDQDSLGVQAQRISSSNNLEVWARPLKDGGRAVGLFNRGTSAATITVNFADLNKWTQYPWDASGPLTVRDLWAKADVGPKTGSYGVSVPSHGLAMLRIGGPGPTTTIAPPLAARGIGLHADGIKVDLPGSHSLQILDLNGRVLWHRDGVGPADYLPGIKGDGSHILRVLAPEIRTDLKF